MNKTLKITSKDFNELKKYILSVPPIDLNSILGERNKDFDIFYSEQVLNNLHVELNQSQIYSILSLIDNEKTPELNSRMTDIGYKMDKFIEKIDGENKKANEIIQLIIKKIDNKTIEEYKKELSEELRKELSKVNTDLIDADIRNEFEKINPINETEAIFKGMLESTLKFFPNEFYNEMNDSMIDSVVESFKEVLREKNYNVVAKETAEEYLKILKEMNIEAVSKRTVTQIKKIQKTCDDLFIRSDTLLDNILDKQNRKSLDKNIEFLFYKNEFSKNTVYASNNFACQFADVSLCEDIHDKNKLLNLLRIDVDSFKKTVDGYSLKLNEWEKCVNKVQSMSSQEHGGRE